MLTNAFYQSGVYDQLNVGSLGALEVMCRRIAALVEAHTQPSRPNWAAAPYLEGSSTSDELYCLACGLTPCGAPRKRLTYKTPSRDQTLPLQVRTRKKKRPEKAKVLTRKGVEGACSRRQMGEASESGKGVGSSLAAVIRVSRTRGDQPRLP